MCVHQFSVDLLILIEFSTSLFAKRRVTFFEDKKEILISQKSGCPFEFNLRAESERLHVATCSRSDKQYRFPDSYTGFGIEIRYTLSAYTQLLFRRNIVRKNIEVKHYVAVLLADDLQSTAAISPFSFTMNEEDIQMAEHPSCSNRKDLCPDVNITCTIDSTNVRYCDGLQGTVLIHDSTVDIVNVSVGLVQNEELSRAFPPI